jgi:hypothetical protein
MTYNPCYRLLFLIKGDTKLRVNLVSSEENVLQMNYRVVLQPPVQ